MPYQLFKWLWKRRLFRQRWIMEIADQVITQGLTTLLIIATVKVIVDICQEKY